MSADFSTGDGHFDCTAAIEELYVYLDGELTEERRGLIAEHLDYCGPCAQAVVFEAELRLVVASRCKERVPDALRERIARLIEAERKRGNEVPEGGQSS